MHPNATLTPRPPIHYPESDGKPLADNTLQLRWIVVIYGNLCALFRDRPDVFVGADQLWYPVEGHPEIVQAPDPYAVFGRPKGHRSSYKQWEEGNVPLTVVFEILSPSNTPIEMADKLAFYDEHGVEEYYVYDPDHNRLLIYLRRGEVLRREWKVQGFVSPRLGIRFDLSGPEMKVYGPDGRPFLTFEALDEARRSAEQRADRMAELARKVLAGQATAEERDELNRLVQPPAGSP